MSAKGILAEGAVNADGETAAMPSRHDVPYQVPLRWWQSLWRYAIVIAISAFEIRAPIGRTTTWFVVDCALGFTSIVLLRYRRRWPLFVGVTTATVFTVSVTSIAPFGLATVSVATRRRWREIATVGAVILIADTVQNYLPFWDVAPGNKVGPLWVELLYYVIVVSVLVGWGLYIGSRRELVWRLRERADHLEREQELHTLQARDAERSKIAREMHDVLAHRISQITMQSEVISFRNDLSADKLRDAARELQANANSALVDLRGVLGVLRDSESGAVMNAPQPSFADIDGLIERARADGVRIVTDITISGDVDGTVGRTLFRLVQECITNAQQHAPGTTLTISVAGSPSTGVDFLATNPLPIRIGARPSRSSSGLGLIGLAERVELVGGTLTTTNDRSGFSVAGHLPWKQSVAVRSLEYAE